MQLVPTESGKIAMERGTAVRVLAVHWNDQGGQFPGGVLVGLR